MTALALPTAASAASFSLTEAGNPDFPQRAYSLEVPEEFALTPDDVTLRENGEAVDSLEVTSAAQGATGDFGTVLAIDASNSMAGEPIEAAMSAARVFADHRAPQQQLAVVLFNREVTVALPFTSDDSAITDALAEIPELGGGTHVFDAVEASVTQIGQSGVRAGSVIVLSDGSDTNSTVPLEDAAASADSAGVRVFPVGLESDAFDESSLQALAVDGTYVNAESPDDLATIYDELGTKLASDYLVEYRSQVERGVQVTVEAEIAGLSGVATASYAAPAASPADSGGPKPDNEGLWESDVALAVTALLIASLLGASLFLLLRPSSGSVRERLARFVAVGAESPRDEEESDTTTPFAALERSFEGRDWWTRFNEELEVAGVEVPPIQVVTWTAVGTIFLAILIGIVGYPILAPTALFIPWVVRALISRQLRSKREEFADQLADNLQVVASAIRAGQSFVGALAIVVEEASEPARSEFKRIVQDERLGVLLEDAIRDVARRMDSRDLEQLALVATIQRESGGNTAEMLDRVVETIRERGELRRLMSILTAQGRLSRVVVSALPPALLIVISLINPGYVAPLFEETGGNIILGVCAGLVIAGSLVIKRLVDIKV
jgi:tight adherence protein B